MPCSSLGVFLRGLLVRLGLVKQKVPQNFHVTADVGTVRPRKPEPEFRNLLLNEDKSVTPWNFSVLRPPLPNHDDGWKAPGHDDEEEWDGRTLDQVVVDNLAGKKKKVRKAAEEGDNAVSREKEGKKKGYASDGEAETRQPLPPSRVLVPLRNGTLQVVTDQAHTYARKLPIKAGKPRYAIPQYPTPYHRKTMKKSKGSKSTDEASEAAPVQAQEHPAEDLLTLSAEKVTIKASQRVTHAEDRKNDLKSKRAMVAYSQPLAVQAKMLPQQEQELIHKLREIMDQGRSQSPDQQAAEDAASADDESEPPEVTPRGRKRPKAPARPRRKMQQQQQQQPFVAVGHDWEDYTALESHRSLDYWFSGTAGTASAFSPASKHGSHEPRTPRRMFPSPTPPKTTPRSPVTPHRSPPPTPLAHTPRRYATRVGQDGEEERIPTPRTSMAQARIQTPRSISIKMG